MGKTDFFQLNRRKKTECPRETSFEREYSTRKVR